jgi:protein gp37
MKKADWHTYQILTKRAERMYTLLSSCLELNPFPNNIWLGVSVENNDYVNRISILKSVKCPNRFISFEPLLGPIRYLNRLLTGIDWVIVGGESGSKARAMKKDWIEDIYQVCSSKGIPFFFKQWGEYDEHGMRTGKKVAGRVYRGKTWNQIPAIQ